LIYFLFKKTKQEIPPKKEVNPSGRKSTQGSVLLSSCYSIFHNFFKNFSSYENKTTAAFC